MKKLLCVLLSCLLIFICLNITAFASVTDESVVYFDDGSYLITTVTESTTTRATKTKSGTKDLSFYNSDDELEWKVTLTGTFSYTGSSATCTNSNISHSVYASKWKITEATASKSSNKAIGDVTAKRYLIGVPVQTVEETITLTCSASGALS